MTRRTLLQTLMGTGLQAVAAASPMPRWHTAHPPRPYVTVGRNPRGTPVLSWQDALNYMQSHPKFQKDLTVLLPQGLNPQAREAFWPEVVREVHGSVELAQAHHFMNGTCPICSASGCDHCMRATELSHRFQRLAIPHGTQYLALTEGQDGRVTYNRIFLGDAIAYRVNVLNGRGFIDLIARCRNSALGQRQEWEAYTAFTPPPPVPVAAAPPPAPAPPPLAPVAPPPAQAVGGSLTTNNYFSTPAPPMAYFGPGPAQFYPRNYSAGSLTLWFQPEVTAVITQTTPGAVAAAGGSTTPAPSTTTTPAVAVGPSTFTTPPPVAAASGSAAQSPPPTSMQLPTPMAAQGASSQAQGPVVR